MPKTKRDKLFFSIIIPTLNEEKYLPTLLKDLSKQSYQNFEVIHVDGNSDDKTVEKAKQFSDKLNIKIFPVKKRHVSFQRNFGAEKAQGKWLIFMDADNKLPGYFLLGIKYQLEKHPTTDGFTCYMNPKKYNPQHKALVTSINIFTEMINSVSATAFGALIGVRKKICTKIKFDENSSFGEDAKFTRDLIKKKYKFRIFKEPAYVYSLRRLEKEGALKLILPASKGFIKNLGIDGFNNIKDYPMLGGSYYSQSNKMDFFKRLDKFMRTASKKQIQQAKKILKQLSAFDF